MVTEKKPTPFGLWRLLWLIGKWDEHQPIIQEPLIFPLLTALGIAALVNDLVVGRSLGLFPLDDLPGGFVHFFAATETGWHGLFLSFTAWWNEWKPWTAPG